MSHRNDALAPGTPPITAEMPERPLGLSRDWLLATAVLVLAFALPLYRLVRFSIHDELYSHIILVPFISVYLVWLKRKTLVADSAPHRIFAWILLAAGAAVFAGYWSATSGGTPLAREDSLALTTISFLLFFGGICAWFLPRNALRAIGFPLAFLIFMSPMPSFLARGIETSLQYGSAAIAYVFFGIAGTTVFHEDLRFQLPGITLQVAPECSGIHSSLALLITSLIAGHLFLHSPWKRGILAFAIVPLALLRNGFRIFVIGELCVHISPTMIDSYIHHHGGPIFFALSLIPFFFLLRFLFKSERTLHSANRPISTL